MSDQATRQEHAVVEEPVRAAQATDTDIEPTSDRLDVDLRGAAISLSREARLHRRTIYGVAAAMTILGGGVLYVGGQAIYENVLFLLPLSVVLPLAFFGLRSAPRKRPLLQTVGTLAHAEDAEALGPLIEALNLDDRDVRALIRDALIDLLPRVKQSEGGVLTDAHQARLCSILRVRVENPLYKDVYELFRPASSKPVALRIAILRALQQIGNRDAIPVVQSLADCRARTPGERAIRDAARECLPALLQRVEQQRAHGMLLRPASAPDADAATLLRPAAGAPTDPVELLLRPASGDVSGVARDALTYGMSAGTEGVDDADVTAGGR